MEIFEQEIMKRVSHSDWGRVREKLDELPPIWKMQNGIHLVTGYGEACDLLSSKKVSSEFISKLSNEVIRFSKIDRINDIIRASFALKDGLRHAKLRELVAPIFVHKKFNDIFSAIDIDAQNLIKDVLLKGDIFDPIESLAKRLPILTNCQILGIPYSEESKLRAMTDALVAEIEFDVEKRNEPELLDLIHFIDSFKSGIAPDWIKPLVMSLHSGDISDLDFESTILLLMISGYGTATSGIGAAIATLFSQEKARNHLRSGQYTTEGFIYEALRLSPPVSILARTAAEDIEFNGSKIPKDGVVLIHVSACCRDPNFFDNPHLFNPKRSNKAQLIFGGGPHFCLGRIVGLRQIEASVNALLNLPLTMTIPFEEISYNPFKIIQGPLTLPLQYHHREMLA